MNTPIQAIDPDGKVVIFINGQWGSIGGIKKTKEAYWTGWDDNSQKRWSSSLLDHWNDQNTLFFDGAVGGQKNTKNNIYASYRWLEDKKTGYSNAKSIISNLSAGETIKFVTNSMGAAFQRGFSSGLRQYILEQQMQVQSQMGPLLLKGIILALQTPVIYQNQR